MSPILFWIFSLFMLGFGAAVIVNKNPVASALSLVVSFLGLAALYIGLSAYFIGIVQVLVYAGAVMVLFLFIIMLLDLKAEKSRKLNWVAFLGGGALTLAFVGVLAKVLANYPAGKEVVTALVPGENPITDDVRMVGLKLFSEYNFPFQVVGVLVLVAAVGVVVLSKRELK